MRVESRSSACVNKREFADIRFILFVPLCDCSNAAPMPKFEASLVAPDELFLGVTHRVISDRVHRLLVTLSYFRPDRFVILLSLIPFLILLLYLLVSGCLTSLC